MYTIVIEKYALKKFSKIQASDLFSIKKSIASLAADPRPAGYKKLKGINAYRIRSGNYRIIYEIYEKIITVVVIDVGHRKDIYKKH